MYEFKMEIDLENLKKQQELLAEIVDNSVSSNSHIDALIGVLGLLGAIQDQIDPLGASEEASAPVAPEKFEPKAMDQYRAVALCEGFETPENDADLIMAWQYLIETRLAWSLQGSFGRIAQRMIDSGLCTPPPQKSSIIKPYRDLFPGK